MIMNIKGINVELAGDKSKRQIIFIHGFPFDMSMWQNQFDKLSENYCCIRYDVRGLGSSFVGDGQYTMEAYVSDLFMIMEELNLDKPVVCGLSMGGYIALRALERDESKFSGAILMDTKPQADDDAGKLKRAEAINKINVEGLDKFVEEFVPNTFAPETIKENEELYNSVIQKAKQHDPTGVKGALLAMVSRTSTTGYLERCKLPVLSIVGNLDKLTPPQVMREFTQQIKNSDFAIAPRCGHLPPLENPGFVNDMIEGFLKKIN
ncbi:MAG: alpha/beta hydrolase [Ignavibacteria bacterium]|nr:MAG: alpha/beta hydrolase [Ignavibacteria bacterium]